MAQEFTLLIVELVKNILSGFARSIKKVTVDINRIVPRGSLYDRVDLIAHRFTLYYVHLALGFINLLEYLGDSF